MDRIAFDTPIGRLALEGQGDVLTALYLPNRPMPPVGAVTPVLCRGRQELWEYFLGKRRSFDLPLAPVGTAFRLRVWNELAAIAYGRVISYGALAQRIGLPKGARAVGQANHHNPLPIFLPCHRVVGTRGELVGYAGGLELKRRLLELEGAL